MTEEEKKKSKYEPPVIKEIGGVFEQAMGISQCEVGGSVGMACSVGGMDVGCLVGQADSTSCATGFGNAYACNKGPAVGK